MLIETDIFGNTIDKVKMSIDRLKAFEPPEGYYLAFSGGKDSVVILDLAKRSGVKFDAHYNITGIDPPELVRFIMKEHPEVERHKPKMTIWKLIVKKMMPPTRLSRYCCEYLKECGGAGRLIVTGVRWGESHRRSKRKMTEVCFRNNRTTYLHPIIEWSFSDVWQYIRENNVKYCSLYDEGFKRLGCIGCPMAGGQRKKQFERWPRYEKLWKKSFGELVERRAAHSPEWHIKHPTKPEWKTADLMFKWWMQGNGGSKEDPDQTVMFE